MRRKLLLKLGHVGIFLTKLAKQELLGIFWQKGAEYDRFYSRVGLDGWLRRLPQISSIGFFVIDQLLFTSRLGKWMRKSVQIKNKANNKTSNISGGDRTLCPRSQLPSPRKEEATPSQEDPLSTNLPVICMSTYSHQQQLVSANYCHHATSNVPLKKNLHHRP